ncbi:MAG: MBL fold metallo-hydrolase, partial [Acidimicrobiales bacterium]
MAIDLMSTLHHSATGVEIHKLVVGPIANNVFVVRCTETGDAALIDAANEHDKLLELARATGVSTILETHGHWDHIAAIPAMREAGYKIGITAEDAPMLSKVSYDYLLEDETVIEVGKLRLRTILNPGHTPGSMSFKLEDHPVLFSGDTLFPGGPGATNTQDGSFDRIIESIDRLLFAPLDADTIVMPGHGDDTTIGAERPSLDEWVS